MPSSFREWAGPRPTLVALIMAIVTASPVHADDEGATSTTRNVILVTMDGLRWQEVFRGAEDALLTKVPGGVANVDGLIADFGTGDGDARRQALLPFVWSVVAREGQLYGNLDTNSPAVVTNGKNFSYPGYNEMLTGKPDPRVDSNAKRPNPNVTVLEWLNGNPEYSGRVAAYACWDVFPFILNAERAGFRVNAGWDPIAGDDLSDRQLLLNDLRATTHRPWEGSGYDSFTVEAALEDLKTRKPRVLYVALGETDEFAHEGRYDHYLHAAHQGDAALRKLWETAQSMPEYAGTTTLIVTTDHGRGDPPDGWKSHGANIPGAEFLWVAILGPDTPALGERRDTEPVTQSQVAATVAAALGEDFVAAAPGAAPPIADAFEPAGP